MRSAYAPSAPRTLLCPQHKRAIRSCCSLGCRRRGGMLTLAPETPCAPVVPPRFAAPERLGLLALAQPGLPHSTSGGARRRHDQGREGHSCTARLLLVHLYDSYD